MNKKRGWKGAHFESDEGASTNRRVFNIKPLEGYYCNQDYELDLYESNEISEEGLLLLGKLKPKLSNTPEFWFRWDAKKQELDVDMYGNANSKRDWINEKHGYKGHHTQRLSKDRKDFRVLVNIPELKVFEGVVNFNLEIDKEQREGVSIHDEAIVVLKKDTPT